ncbi:MAG: hypothetical protein QOD83_1460 [Solirubrobacteraceae bacterium]|jgi:hypothetical protein|nr:hypothetical protein [Solirubrobacteraceae bacterium]
MRAAAGFSPTVASGIIGSDAAYLRAAAVRR